MRVCCLPGRGRYLWDTWMARNVWRTLGEHKGGEPSVDPGHRRVPGDSTYWLLKWTGNHEARPKNCIFGQ